jgi:type I restriction enzyme S subunit
VKLVKLGNLASIQTGKIDVNKAVVGGKYPFFTCSRDVYEIDDAPFEGKAVLVAGNGDLNVKYYEGKFNAYQRTYFLFVNDEEELLPRYLYWFLESYVGQLRSESIGSTIKYIKMGNLTDAEIPLLSIEKQREIVEKLDRAFAEIELAGIHLRKRVSSYCSLEEAFINERLRQNCETFTSKKLSDITSKIGSGATPRGGEESYKSEGISLIRSLNVYDDGFREKKLAFIDEVQAKALANVEIKTGDVLLNITGASIARTCIAPKEYLPARVNQHVSVIRPKPEIISTEYLHFLLRSQRMKSSLLGVGNSGGSTRQALTKVDLENTIIEFPPDLEDQKEAVDDLKSFVDLSKTYMNNLSKIESLYLDLQNSLLISELSGSIN